MSLSLRYRNRPPFIESSGRPAYLAATMFRLLSSMLVAIALLLSPMVMTSGGAMAAPHNPTMVVGMDGHCAETDVPSGNDRSKAMADCTVTCPMFASVEPMVADNGSPAKEDVFVAKYATLIGIRPEGEKPPPRITPEI